MKKIISLIALIALYHASFGQAFKGEASLPKVEVDGFYRISLTPELSQYLTSNFSNIRIHNAEKKEIPYILQAESRRYYTEEFKEYKILEKKQAKNCCTSLVLHNPEGTSINNIILSIKNAEVTKYATLLGSDDQQEWFALKQSFSFNSIIGENQTSEIKIVDFPLSNYSYYKLLIDDSTSAPLNILKAGYFRINSEEGKFTEIRGQRITAADSAKEKKTYIRISYDTLRTLDRFMLTMSGPTYFLRHASLSVKKQRINRKKEKEFYFEHVSEFEISSKQTSFFEFSGLKTSELLIEINNQDNTPLQVTSAKVYQLNRYLTALLKAGDNYVLKFGGAELQAPQYDLVFFKDRIPSDPITLTPLSITVYEEKDTKSPTFFTNRAIIWVAIGVIAVVLAAMSFKLVNETSAKNE